MPEFPWPRPKGTQRARTHSIRRLADAADHRLFGARPGHHRRTFLDVARHPRVAATPGDASVDLGTQSPTRCRKIACVALRLAAGAHPRRRAGQSAPRPRHHERGHRGFRSACGAGTGTLPEHPRHHRRRHAVAWSARYGGRHDRNVRHTGGGRCRQSRGACPAASARP